MLRERGDLSGVPPGCSSKLLLENKVAPDILESPYSEFSLRELAFQTCYLVPSTVTSQNGGEGRAEDADLPPKRRVALLGATLKGRPGGGGGQPGRREGKGLAC